jgi:hypothetical protein
MNKTTNETVQSMQHLDSLKAVKVAMDMNKAQDKTIDMLVNLVGTMDKNMKLLATKVLELEKDKDILFELIKGQEKSIQSLEGYANREV